MDSNIQISQTIDVDDFKNLLCGAWHYCHYFLNVDCDPASSWFFHLYPAKWKNNATIEEMVWAYLKDGHKLTAHDVESDEQFYLTWDKIVEGTKVFCQEFPGHWDDFKNENDDAITADVWMQCVCFGDVVYG